MSLMPTRPLLFIAGLPVAIAAGLFAWLQATPYSAPAPSLPLQAPLAAGLEPSDTAPRFLSVELTSLIPADASLPLGTELPPATEHPDSTALRGATPYLLAGLDRSHRGRYGRTDSLMVAFFDDASSRVGAVSIPRDLFVEIPGHGPARINATLRIAERLGQPPLETLLRVVSDTLSIRIEHALVADLGIFEATIDALGGVSVLVPCPIIDNFHDPRTESGFRRLDVAAGETHFDGITAAMYIRSRHGRSDWSRARRQQAVLLGLRNRIRNLGVSTWAPALHHALSHGVISTMSRLELINLVRRLRHVDPTRMHGIVIGSREVTQHRTSDGQAVLLPNHSAA